jgi:uncharacterized iron-regulated membrane protein
MSVPARRPELTTLRPRADLWGPLLIGVVTILFAFPAGMTLAVINWHRMGMIAKARSRLIVALVATYLFVVALILTGPLGQFLYLAVNIGLFFYLRREMDNDIDAYAYAGNEVHPANRALAVAIGFGILLVLALLYAGTAILLVELGVLSLA